MITNNSVAYGGKIFVEIITDIIFFPVWWYTRGAFLFTKKLLNFLGNKQKALALLVWIKNLHRPMYGQYDWQGMLISFFMRLVQIIFRSLVMLFWLVIVFVCFCFWLILPLFVLYEIIFQLHG